MEKSQKKSLKFKNKKPMRRCIGCMESKEKNQLIRIAYYEGELTIDPRGTEKGRGIYLCPSEKCIKLAVKKRGLERGLHRRVDQEQKDKVFGELLRNERKNI